MAFKSMTIEEVLIELFGAPPEYFRRPLAKRVHESFDPGKDVLDPNGAPSYTIVKPHFEDSEK